MCIIVIVLISKLEGCYVLKHNVVKTKLEQSGQPDCYHSTSGFPTCHCQDHGIKS